MQNESLIRIRQIRYAAFELVEPKCRIYFAHFVVV
ncbi:unnamed protein product [Dracunculus medinensis]|uniref:Chorismate--pyruvate lyase n=1 Tax=Dracunculus medinensis TaxID=318479 RepID=A0A0N4U7P8_DRAME|nr:unnamed protein product [Dracunculus medinensis]